MFIIEEEEIVRLGVNETEKIEKLKTLIDRVKEITD